MLYRGGFGTPSTGVKLIEPGSSSPAASSVDYQLGSVQAFTATLLTPILGSLGVSWYLDGTLVPGANVPSFAFQQNSANPSTRTLQLRVRDNTPFVNAAMAGSLLDHAQTWTIRVVDTRLFANGFEQAAASPVANAP